MRKVTRPTASAALIRYLAKRQRRADAESAAGILNMEASWKAARKTVTVISGLTLLQNAMGATARCMYCVDSHGTDIDHYRPKAPYPSAAFDWFNMVLCCTPCGRIKGDRFPVSANTGLPLLVNPLNENPWDSLSFDPLTGNMTARFNPVAMSSDAKGAATVETLRLDRREAIAAGYRRTFLRLDSHVAKNLPALTAGTMTAAALVQGLRALDDHYLLEWCLSDEGSTYGSFNSLSTTLPLVWHDCTLAL